MKEGVDRRTNNARSLGLELVVLLLVVLFIRASPVFYFPLNGDKNHLGGTKLTRDKKEPRIITRGKWNYDLRSGERAVVYGTDLTKRCGGHKKGLAQARDGGGTKKLESYSIFLGFSVGPRKRCRCSLHRPRSSFAVLKVFSSSPLFLFLPPLFVHYAVLCILLLHKLPSLGCHSLGGPTFF